jgi:hypothetical protein
MLALLIDCVPRTTFVIHRGRLVTTLYGHVIDFHNAVPNHSLRAFMSIDATSTPANAHAIPRLARYAGCVN